MCCKMHLFDKYTIQKSSDGRYLVIKVREVRIAKEVKRSDDW